MRLLMKVVMDLSSTLPPFQHRLHETTTTSTILSTKNPGNEKLPGGKDQGWMWKSGRRLCRWQSRSSCLISLQVAEESASNSHHSENSGKMRTSPMSLVSTPSTGQVTAVIPADRSLFQPVSRWFGVSPIKGQGLIPAKGSEWLQEHPVSAALTAFALVTDTRRWLIPVCSHSPWPKQPCCSLCPPLRPCLSLAPSDAEFMSRPVQRLLCIVHVYSAMGYEPSWYCVS